MVINKTRGTGLCNVSCGVMDFDAEHHSWQSRALMCTKDMCPNQMQITWHLLLSSNLLRISAHLFGAPLPCSSPCPLPGVFSLCPMDHLTVRTLWYFSRYFSHFSLPRNVLHCEGIEPHTFCCLSLIFDSVACATVQWLSLT